MSNKEIFDIEFAKSDKDYIDEKLLINCMNKAAEKTAEELFEWMQENSLTSYDAKYLLKLWRDK